MAVVKQIAARHPAGGRLGRAKISYGCNADHRLGHRLGSWYWKALKSRRAQLKNKLAVMIKAN